jgi:hypothetical protein
MTINNGTFRSSTLAQVRFIKPCLVLDYKGMDCSYPEANLVGSWLTDTLLFNLLTRL